MNTHTLGGDAAHAEAMAELHRRAARSRGVDIAQGRAYVAICDGVLLCSKAGKMFFASAPEAKSAIVDAVRATMHNAARRAGTGKLTEVRKGDTQKWVDENVSFVTYGSLLEAIQRDGLDNSPVKRFQAIRERAQRIVRWFPRGLPWKRK